MSLKVKVDPTLALLPITPRISRHLGRIATAERRLVHQDHLRASLDVSEGFSLSRTQGLNAVGLRASHTTFKPAEGPMLFTFDYIKYDVIERRHPSPSRPDHLQTTSRPSPSSLASPPSRRTPARCWPRRHPPGHRPRPRHAPPDWPVTRSTGRSWPMHQPTGFVWEMKRQDSMHALLT